MKVKQLIKKLQKLDQNAELVCSDEFSEDVFDITSVGENYIGIAVQFEDDHSGDDNE